METFGMVLGTTGFIYGLIAFVQTTYRDLLYRLETEMGQLRFLHESAGQD